MHIKENFNIFQRKMIIYVENTQHIRSDEIYKRKWGKLALPYRCVPLYATYSINDLIKY